MYLKRPPIVSKHLRNAAKGEQCTVGVVGVCLSPDTATTVLAHLADGFGGMGKKAGEDITAVFACDACHAAIDGRTRCPEFVNHKFEYLFRALCRTVIRQVELHNVTIKGYVIE